MEDEHPPVNANLPEAPWPPLPVSQMRMPPPPLPPARTPKQLHKATGHRIPGPAGALDAILERSAARGIPSNSHDLHLCSLAFSPSLDRGFSRTEAWMALDELIADEGAPRGRMQVTGRSTLEELRVAASVPPPFAPRAAVLCVVIKSIDSEGGGGGEDVAATLADETGSMPCTLHTTIFNEHPGAIVVGAAMALTQVPMLTLSPWSHHLVVVPQCVAHVVPPVVCSALSSQSSAGAADAKVAPVAASPAAATSPPVVTSPAAATSPLAATSPSAAASPLAAASPDVASLAVAARVEEPPLDVSSQSLSLSVAACGGGRAAVRAEPQLPSLAVGVVGRPPCPLGEQPPCPLQPLRPRELASCNTGQRPVDACAAPAAARSYLPPPAPPCGLLSAKRMALSVPLPGGPQPLRGGAQVPLVPVPPFRSSIPLPAHSLAAARLDPAVADVPRHEQARGRSTACLLPFQLSPFQPPPADQPPTAQQSMQWHLLPEPESARKPFPAAPSSYPVLLPFQAAVEQPTSQRSVELEASRSSRPSGTPPCRLSTVDELENYSDDNS